MKSSPENPKSFLVTALLTIGIVSVCATLLTLGVVQHLLQTTGLELAELAWPVHLRIILLNGGMLVVSGLLLSLLWYRQLAQPLRKLSDVLHARRLPQESVTLLLSRSACAEVAACSQAAFSLLTLLHTFLARVDAASQQIRAASETLLNIVNAQSALLPSQIKPTHEMAAAVRELAVTAQQIGHEIRDVAAVANQTLQFADKGRQAVMNVVKNMEDIQRASQVNSDKILALEQQSEHIHEVVQTIDRIIEDTRLIAFNATIEAVRARDEGQGFGVVALEIKRLAEEVFGSTEDIKELIQEIQRASRALVLTAEDGVKTVRRGVLLAEEAGAALSQIFNMIRITTDSAQRIASATRQQQSASEQVFASVEMTAHSAEQFAQAIRQVADVTAELHAQADDLRREIQAHRAPTAG